MSFTASECLKKKLDRARELLSHAIPPNDLPTVIERALDQLIEREEQRRYAVQPKRTASNRSVGAGAVAEVLAEQPETSPRELRQPETLERESEECEVIHRRALERESLKCELHAPC